MNESLPTLRARMPSHKHLTEIASSGSSTGKSQHKYFAFVPPVYSPQCWQWWKPGGTSGQRSRRVVELAYTTRRNGRNDSLCFSASIAFDQAENSATPL